jgi:PAS domain S-box-containing protein
MPVLQLIPSADRVAPSPIISLPHSFELQRNLNRNVTLGTFRISASWTGIAILYKGSSNYRDLFPAKAVWPLHSLLIDISLKQFADASVDLIQITDEEGGFAYVNPAWRARFDYTDAELSLLTMSDLLVDETRAVSLEAFGSLLSGGPVSLSMGLTLRSHAGELVAIDGNISAATGANGTRLSVGVFREVDQRRRIDARLAPAYDAATLLVAVMDADGTIIEANHGWEAQLGYPQAFLRGSPIDNLMVGNSFRAIRSVVSIADGEINAPGPVSTRVAFVGQDGSTHDFDCTVSPGANLGELFFLAQQAYGQIRTQTELEQSEERFKSVFERSPLGMALVAADETIMSVNPAMERLIGYNDAEIAGRTFKSLRPADAPAPESAGHRRMVAGEQITQQNEGPFQRKDGSVFIGRSTWAPVRREDGVFLHSVRTVEDVSEQRRTQRFTAEFLAIVGHELRTPLTSINAVLGLLAEGSIGELSPHAQDLVKLAQDNSNRLRLLVDDLLDLDRLTASRTPLNVVSVGLKTPVEMALMITGVTVQSRLVSDIPSELVVAADIDRVAQVLANLFANAIKFSTEDAPVEVRARAAGDGFVHISVADHGQGIPADQLVRIFDRFYQIDSSDTRHAGGTGIGLAIAKQIVQAHGGQIWAESALGEGSTFTFSLPQAKTV